MYNSLERCLSMNDLHELLIQNNVNISNSVIDNDPTAKKNLSERYHIVFESSINPIIIIDKESKIVDMNTSGRKLFFELKEKYFFEGTVYDTLTWLIKNYDEFLKSNSNTFSFDQVFHSKKGTKYYDIKLVRTSTYDGRIDEIAIIMTNITGYKKITKELSESKIRYQSLFRNMFDYCSYNKLIVDKNNIPIDFTVLDINEALLKSMDMKRDEIIGKKGSEIFPFLNATDFDWLNNFGKAATNGENIRIKELYLASINKWYSISIYSSEDGYFVFVHSDITKKKIAEENVVMLAYYDVLTGLPNGKHLDDKIKAAIDAAKDNKNRFAVMFIDIINFKKINNTLGHKTGDSVLKHVAERLKLISEDEDTVARLGGDKFVIIHRNIENKYDAAIFADNITEAFSPPFTYNTHEFFIQFNIGISIYPEDADNMHTLKRNADTAMFAAKSNPDLRYQFHVKEMNEKALRDLKMEADLRRALSRNELLLHYQPLVNIKTGRIVALEALLRWDHPDAGIIPPSEFIPIAEENGLIVPIGEWVLNVATKQCKQWHINGYADIYVTVNVSVNQLRMKSFAQNVKRILDEAALEPRHLCIEIAESIYVQHIDTILETLISLKNMGIKLSLDDFGAGYSSLNYINKLPINILKIDKSFINNINSCHDYSIITNSIIKIAHQLNFDVIAEGVETKEELDLLKLNKCDEIQGYLFSHPIPPESVNTILSDGKNLYNKN